MTSIGTSAFSGCSGLTGDLKIPDSVTSIGYSAFSSCRGLTSIEIPDGVTSIGDYVFCYCSGLTSVTVGSGVTSIGDYVFDGCSGLNSVTVGSGVTSIGEGAFRDCSGLKSVTIESGVTSIGWAAFYGCSGLMRVYIHDLSAWYKIDFEIISSNPLNYAHHLYVDNMEMKELTIPDEITEIKNNTFAGCSGLTSVTIHDGVNSIGDDAFRNCSGLEKVIISDFSAWCKIDFENYDANPLYYAHHLYVDNAEVKELTIPNKITEIKPFAFYECSGLTGVTIPDSVTSIGQCAFYDCSRLTSVSIGSGVTEIGGSAFKGCDKIIQKEGNVHYVDQWAIGCDSSATEIALRAGTKGIADYAFSDCTSLKSVALPESVMCIGQYAFKNCPLESVTVQGSATWQVAKTSDFTGAETVTVTDPAQYVDYFTFNYVEYYWKRSV